MIGNVEILRAVENKSKWCAVGVILEIPCVFAVGLRQNNGVVGIVVCCNTVYGLACAYSVFIIGIAIGIIVVNNAFKISAGIPSVFLITVGKNITVIVIGKLCVVYSGQFVLSLVIECATT